MTEKEMVKYIESTGWYWKNETYGYERELMTTNKTIPIKELVERFIDMDKYYNGKPWNIRQILANINMIIPVEDRTNGNV